MKSAIAQNAYAAYRKTEVETLRPVEIVSRLFSTMLLKLRSAHVAIEEGDVAVKGEALSMAFAILGELHSSLDMEQGGEIAANLNDLYGHLFTELTFVNLHSDPERLAGAIKTIAPLVEAWTELASSNTKGPAEVVEESEEVVVQSGQGGGSSGQAPLASGASVTLSAVL